MDLFNQEMSLSCPEGRSRATVFPVTDMGFSYRTKYVEKASEVM